MINSGMFGHSTLFTATDKIGGFIHTAFCPYRSRAKVGGAALKKTTEESSSIAGVFYYGCRSVPRMESTFIRHIQQALK